MFPTEIVLLVAQLSRRPSTYSNIKCCSQATYAALTEITTSCIDGVGQPHDVPEDQSIDMAHLCKAEVVVCGAIWKASVYSAQDIVCTGGGKCVFTAFGAVPDASLVLGMRPLAGDVDDFTDIIWEIFGRNSPSFYNTFTLWRLERIPRRHIITTSKYLHRLPENHEIVVHAEHRGVSYPAYLSKKGIRFETGEDGYHYMWPQMGEARDRVFVEGMIMAYTGTLDSWLPVLDQLDAAMLVRVRPSFYIWRCHRGYTKNI